MDNALARTEISTASTGEQRETVATRSVIAAVQGIDVEQTAETEARPDRATLVVTLARAIDLEARVIAPAVRVQPAEIGLAVATCQAVLEIGAPSMAPDPAAAVPAPAAVEVLPAWVVRVGALAEVVVEAAAVVAVGGGNRTC